MRYFITKERKRCILEMKVSGESALKSFSDKGAFDEFLSDIDASLNNQKLVDNSTVSIVKKSDGTENWTIKLDDSEGHKGNIKFEISSNGDIKYAQTEWDTDLKFAGASLRSNAFLSWLSDVSENLTSSENESEEKTDDSNKETNKDVMSEVKPEETQAGVWTKIIEQSMDIVLNDMQKEYGLSMQRLFTFNLNTQNELKDEEEWLSYEGTGYDKNHVSHKIVLVILKRKNGNGEYRISVDDKEITRLKDQQNPNGFVDWCRDNMSFQTISESKDFSSKLRNFNENSHNGLRGLDRKRHVGCSNLCCNDLHDDDEFGDTNWRDPINTLKDDFDDTGWEYEDLKDVLEDEIEETRKFNSSMNTNTEKSKPMRRTTKLTKCETRRNKLSFDYGDKDSIIDLVTETVRDVSGGSRGFIDVDEETLSVVPSDHACTSVFNMSDEDHEDKIVFYGVNFDKYSPRDIDIRWIKKLSLMNPSDREEAIYSEFKESVVEHAESIEPSDSLQLPATSEAIATWVDTCLKGAIKNEEMTYNSFYETVKSMLDEKTTECRKSESVKRFTKRTIEKVEKDDEDMLWFADDLDRQLKELTGKEFNLLVRDSGIIHIGERYVIQYEVHFVNNGGNGKNLLRVVKVDGSSFKKIADIKGFRFATSQAKEAAKIIADNMNK